ncbi:hypothetical protein DXG01_009676 [Tephrocybe rancida]|nr:hypothetical protein DXG01_009676 [Tephrocybe rancida]
MLSITAERALSLKSYVLLLLFSSAQLLDLANVTSSVIALPDIAQDLDLAASESQWVVNAYTLTFGAFLLTGGRFSAVYGPKALFIAGFTVVGLGALVCGFAVNAPMLFVIRALQGIGAAMTIPSAITMIVLLFPNRGEQDRALGLFAGFGAVGNMGGLIIGGTIAEKVGWRWSFWIMAMVILPMCLVAFFLSPSPERSRSSSDVYKNMDWAGLFLITACTLLFVFAVTEGNVRGWRSKEVLAPLIVSILLLPLFGYVESIATEPLIPSWIWTLPTFTPLFFYVLSIYAYLNILVFQMSEIFQHVWNVTAINAAIRILPFCFAALIATVGAGMTTAYVSPRWVLVGCQLLTLVGAILFAFAETKATYWPLVVPSFILMGIANPTGFVFSNISMLRAPLFKPGVDLSETTALVGAIFNANLQIGSSVGLAIVTAITAETGHGDPSNFTGYKNGWWFVAGLAGFEAVVAAVSLRGSQLSQDRMVKKEGKSEIETELASEKST